MFLIRKFNSASQDHLFANLQAQVDEEAEAMYEINERIFVSHS